MLVDAGIKDIDKLQEIGSFIYDEVNSLYERGVDSGRESCDCEGCCDDYVYYSDHRDAVREAKEEGDEEGYGRGLDDARSESESEIKDLKSRIEELESQLNETVNKKNTKRI